MTYSENGPELVYFTDEEEEKIDVWLTKHGYEWGRATVCGGCCGTYADEYWVDGIGGEFKKGDENRFKRWAKRNNISCEVEGYTIKATNPT